MGFYIRKSVRLGPLRFNLSKSGIGVSGGIRGLRIGTGPRGNYIHVGGGGLYYRRTLPSERRPPGDSGDPPDLTPTRTPRDTHGPMESITSGSVAHMVDSSSAALLAELNQKRRQLPVCPIVSVLSVVAVVVSIAVGTPAWVPLLVSALTLPGIFLAYRRNVLVKTVVMMYDLDENCLGAYHSLHDALASLEQCGGVWQVCGREDVYDGKYHAGAGYLVSRRRLHVSEGHPAFVRTNVSVIRLGLDNKSVYFLPDRILVYASDGIGAVNYKDLRLEAAPRRFIEDGSVPADAQVVDHTWRYVNKNGGPDRRFSYNPELPVCLYEEIRLCTDSGLNEMLQTSRVGIGAELAASTAAMSSVLATAHENHPKQEGVVNRDDLYESLLDVICCVMVADGRASRREKAAICELMLRARVPWPVETVHERIAQFVQRVRTVGYRAVASEALSRAPLFKEAGRAAFLLKCVDFIATADGVVSPAEAAFRNRLQKALG